MKVAPRNETGGLKQAIPEPLEDAPTGGRRYSNERILAICSITFLVAILVISSAADIVRDFVEESVSESDYGNGPEFGYRLDLDPSRYEDLAANRNGHAPSSSYPSFSSTVLVEGECVVGVGNAVSVAVVDHVAARLLVGVVHAVAVVV